MEKRKVKVMMNHWMKELEYLGVSQNVTLNFSNMKTSLGACSSARFVDDHEIKISNYILNEPDELIENTIIHELLHTIRPEDKHGGAWTKSAAHVREKYGYDIQVTAKNNVINIPSKYLIVCEKCNNNYEYHRAGKVVKNTQSYKCKCGGSLKRVR